MNQDRIIYSIVVEDINTVAEEILGRNPIEDEVKFIEEKIGDHISWYDIIENLLHDYKGQPKQENSFKEK